MAGHPQSGYIDSPVPHESGPSLQTWEWKHPPRHCLPPARSPGSRMLWSIQVNESHQCLFPNLLHPATVDFFSRVPESITPVVSQCLTGVGEVRNPSSLTVQSPAGRPGVPAIVFRTPGIVPGDLRAPISQFSPSSLFCLLFGLLLPSLSVPPPFRRRNYFDPGHGHQIVMVGGN